MIQQRAGSIKRRAGLFIVANPTVKLLSIGQTEQPSMYVHNMELQRAYRVSFDEKSFRDAAPYEDLQLILVHTGEHADYRTTLRAPSRIDGQLYSYGPPSFSPTNGSDQHSSNNQRQLATITTDPYTHPSIDW